MKVVEQNRETTNGKGKRKGILSANQGGFQAGIPGIRSAVQPAGVMKATVETLWSQLSTVLKQKGKVVPRADFGGVAFMDAEKYYDSVTPESIEVCMAARRVPEWLIALYLEAGHEAASCMLVPPIGISPLAELQVSLRQGSTEAPSGSLFVSDVLLAELEADPCHLPLVPAPLAVVQGAIGSLLMCTIHKDILRSTKNLQ